MFLVQEKRSGWLEVLLPVRPNGSTGWVRERGGQLLLQEPLGIGTADTPTPGGVYYLRELLRPPDPGTVYGPYADGLSGFSNVLTSFEGGEGVIGLHGNNDPSSLGSDVSAGCIRMDNDTNHPDGRDAPPRDPGRDKAVRGRCGGVRISVGGSRTPPPPRRRPPRLRARGATAPG